MAIAESSVAAVDRPLPPAEILALRKVAWYTILALVFIVPLAMSNWTLRGMQTPIAVTHDLFDTIKVLFQRVLTTIALVAWTSSMLTKGGTLRWTVGVWLLIAFLGWATLSAVLSIHPPTALFGSYKRYEGLFSFINYAVIFLLVMQLADESRRRRELAGVAFASAVLVSLYGVVQFLGVDPIEWGPLLYQHRSFSTYGSPVLLGGYLVLVLPVAIATAFTTRNAWWRLACWFGVLLIAWCWIVTFARGAWIGGAVGLAVLGVGLFACHRVKFRLVDGIAAVLVLLMGVGVVAKSLHSPSAITNVVKRVQSMASVDEASTETQGSAKTRTQIWQAAFAAIKDRPVVGFGADTFRLVFPKYKPAEYVQGIGHLAVADNAHNYPIQLAACVGIPAFVLLYAVFAWVGIGSAKVAFQPTDVARSDAANHDRMLLLGFWAAFAGYLASLLFGISVTGSTVLQWVYMGALLAPVVALSRVRATAWGMAGAVIIALLGLAVIVFWSVWFYADHEALKAHLAPDFRTKVAAARSATRLNPYNGHYRTNLGLVYKEAFVHALRQAAQAEAATQNPRPYSDVARRALRDAESALEDAIAYTPDEYDNYVALSDLYNLAGNAYRESRYFDKAIAAAREGIKVEPFGPAVRYQLAWAYAKSNQTSRAIEELEFAHSLDPAFVDCALGLASLHAAERRYDRALAVLKATKALGADAGRVKDTIAAIEASRASDTTGRSR